MLVLGVIVANAAAVLVCWVAWWTTRSVFRGTGRATERLTRRRQQLRHDPDRARWSDVELVLAEAVPAARARGACRHGRTLAVPAPVAWLWLDAYGPEMLALALESGMTRTEMVHHLASGNLPDPGALRVFATLRGAAAA